MCICHVTHGIDELDGRLSAADQQDSAQNYRPNGNNQRLSYPAYNNLLRPGYPANVNRPAASCAVLRTLPLSWAEFAGIRQTDSNLTNLKLLALYIFKQFRYIFVKIPEPSLRPEQT